MWPSYLTYCGISNRGCRFKPRLVIWVLQNSYYVKLQYTYSFLEILFFPENPHVLIEIAKAVLQMLKYLNGNFNLLNYGTTNKFRNKGLFKVSTYFTKLVRQHNIIVSLLLTFNSVRIHFVPYYIDSAHSS